MVGMAVLLVNKHVYKIKLYTTDIKLFLYIGLPKVGLLLFKLSMHHAEHLTMILTYSHCASNADSSAMFGVSCCRIGCAQGEAGKRINWGEPELAPH